MMSACLKVMLLCLFYYTLGENFDRQASIRRSLIYTDTVVRRPKKVKRRKTITGVPDNIQKELGMAHQNCIPSLFIFTAYHYLTNNIYQL
uniref:Secreted protein n=1 Tax=Chelydra serpentina TaxID=8475 RepID=A0A8C3S5B7_CHESE